MPIELIKTGPNESKVMFNGLWIGYIKEKKGMLETSTIKGGAPYFHTGFKLGCEKKAQEWIVNNVRKS